MPDETDPFEGTARYYRKYRPGYSDAAIQYVRQRFGLDGTDRVLDLGCGTGQIAVPVAAFVDEVVGMDPNEAMIREARAHAAAASRPNVRFVVGSDAQLGALRGSFDLATMGRSFHWMNQDRTLAELARRTGPDGGIAILGDVEWLTHGEREWQVAVYEVVDEYVDTLPARVPASELEYDEPWDVMLADFGFVDVETQTFELERSWTAESVLGYLHSLSFCGPAMLDDDIAAFESAVRGRLEAFGREPFLEAVEERVISGWNPGRCHGSGHSVDS